MLMRIGMAVCHDLFYVVNRTVQEPLYVDLDVLAKHFSTVTEEEGSVVLENSRNRMQHPDLPRKSPPSTTPGIIKLPVTY
jgi:hypothetical protein